MGGVRGRMAGDSISKEDHYDHLYSALGLEYRAGIITLKPLLGLANRLRALASAQILADSTGRFMNYYWEVNEDCAASDSILFSNYPYLGGISAEEYALQKKGAMVLLDSEIRERKNVIEQAALAPDRQLVMETCYQFRPDTIAPTAFDHLFANYLQDLQPSVRVLNRASQIGGERSADIGIHIRRTDNVKANSFSIDEQFVKAIDAILEACPSTTFYLATDCEDTKQKFKGKYGGAIHTANIDYSRGTPQGVVDAFAELLVLSKTLLLLGSYHSSYSEVAAKKGGIPLRKVGVDGLEKILPGLHENILLLAQRAKAARDSGDHDCSIELYQRALQVEPHNPHHHYFIATALAAKKKFDIARQHLQQVQELCPGHSSAASLLKKINEK